MIVGNDISRWQGDVNFDVYKNNTNFLIIKTSDGIGFVDPKFYRNQAEARRVGIPLGYYHFARPDLNNSGSNEADYFLKVIGTINEGEILCLDYEPKSNPFPVVSWCKSFLDRIYQVTGVKPFIYLSQSQVRSFDWSPIINAGYALWLAAYVATDKAFTGQWGKMAMQQWTSSQAVPGISGNVDGNWFFGTLEQFKLYGYHKPVTPSSSISPSVSPSSSNSASISQSASVSPSVSSSASTSPSPSPSPEIDECEELKARLRGLDFVINGKWTWVGKNGWKNNLALLKKLLIA